MEQVKKRGEFLQETSKSRAISEIRTLGSRILSTLSSHYKKNLNNEKALLSLDYILDNFRVWVKTEGSYKSAHNLSNAYNEFLVLSRPFHKELHKNSLLKKDFQSFYTGLFLLIKKGELMSLGEQELYESIGNLALENLSSTPGVTMGSMEHRFWNFGFQVIYGYFAKFPADIIMFAQQNISQPELDSEGRIVRKEEAGIDKITLSFASLVLKEGLTSPRNKFWGSLNNLEHRILSSSYYAAKRLKKGYAVNKLLAALYYQEEKDLVPGAKNSYKERVESAWLSQMKQAAFAFPSKLSFRDSWDGFLRILQYLFLMIFRFFSGEKFVFSFQLICFVYFLMKAKVSPEWNRQISLELNDSKLKWLLNRFGIVLIRCREFAVFVSQKIWVTFFFTDNLNKVEKTFHTIFLISLGYGITLMKDIYESGVFKFVVNSFNFGFI